MVPREERSKKDAATDRSPLLLLISTLGSEERRRRGQQQIASYQHPEDGCSSSSLTTQRTPQRFTRPLLPSIRGQDDRDRKAGKSDDHSSSLPTRARNEELLAYCLIKSGEARSFPWLATLPPPNNKNKRPSPLRPIHFLPSAAAATSRPLNQDVSSSFSSLHLLPLLSQQETPLGTLPPSFLQKRA